MRVDTAKNLFKFMERVQLQGSEVPAYNQCMIELNEMIQRTGAPSEPTISEEKQYDGGDEQSSASS